ncbi:MAG: glutathione S-transferase family protein [Gammaproteobacteria bacterium]|nr:glutathione S-transferase family protein [Gammaproteobacteria bacterium]
MRLFWAPQTRSTRAIWMLEEAGIEYEMELVDIRSPDRKDSDEFLTASPMGKVPAIVDGETAMSESAAICIYIADRYGDGKLAPPIDDAKRGKYLYWAMYTPAVIEPAMSEKFNEIESNRVRSGWGDFDLMIKTFDEGLEGKQWILGDQFTAADVMLGSSAVFMRMFEMLPDTRNIGDYADRCLARPAYQKALSLSET